MSNLQIILISVFIVLTIVAVLIFAGIIPIGGGPAAVGGTVTIWGTVSTRDFLALTDTFSSVNRNITINYVEKSAATFDEELTEALATGTGPDLFTLSSDSILKHQAKIFAIPYANYQEAAFRNDFVSEAELYLTPDGILGLPLYVDPLVMFYNRTIFDNAGIAAPPAFWDEFTSLVPELTARQGGRITQAGAALGGAGNIPHAKDIIAAMVLQTGNPIVSQSDGLAEATLAEGQALSALGFYTSFANSALGVYSWNESLPDARTAFAAGNVAIYFGPGSELFFIRDANPNLDFDVRALPQIRDANTVTFGKLISLAIAKNTANLPLAFQTAVGLTNASAIPNFIASLNLPPARRDLLGVRQTGTYLPIFYGSALQAKGWLDPDSARTESIFQRMISDIVAGRADASDAIDDAEAEIDLLLRP